MSSPLCSSCNGGNVTQSFDTGYATPKSAENSILPVAMVMGAIAAGIYFISMRYK